MRSDDLTANVKFIAVKKVSQEQKKERKKWAVKERRLPVIEDGFAFREVTKTATGSASRTWSETNFGFCKGSYYHISSSEEERQFFFFTSPGL